MENRLVINSKYLDRDDSGYLYYNKKLFTGIEEWYYDTDEIGTTTEYLNGIPHGWMKGWYKNGKMSSKRKYKKGRINGEVTKWYENGKIKYSAEIYNAKAVWKKEWDEEGNLTTNFVREEV